MGLTLPDWSTYYPYKRLRQIRNARHFRFALNLVFKVVCGGFGIALLTP
ncbi:DUF3265 domain-containing protein [Vibrio alginolyticus]|nr:DUF3265 domain-containing protein [Vibrio alginolyticus]